MQTDVEQAFRMIAKTAAELEATILSGWPFEDSPTDVEARRIQSVFDELSLHEPTISDGRRWYVAGQAVARIRRDEARAARTQ